MKTLILLILLSTIACTKPQEPVNSIVGSYDVNDNSWTWTFHEDGKLTETMGCGQYWFSYNELHIVSGMLKQLIVADVEPTNDGFILTTETETFKLKRL